MIRLVFPDPLTAIRLVDIGRAAFDGREHAWNVFDYILRGAMPGALLLADIGVERGFISLQCAADEAEILNIATVPAARGKGLARALLAEGERLCQESGARRMFLEVAVDNDPALRLYQGAGYAEVGGRKAYYKRPDGSWADALILAKDLSGDAPAKADLTGSGS